MFIPWKGGVVSSIYFEFGYHLLKLVCLAHSFISAFLVLLYFGSLNPTLRSRQILGVLDTGRDAWIHREDWIKNGIHVGSGRKYKDSYFLQSQLMCYYNS